MEMQLVLSRMPCSQTSWIYVINSRQPIIMNRCLGRAISLKNCFKFMKAYSGCPEVNVQSSLENALHDEKKKYQGEEHHLDK